ncbi:MAG TPA: 1-deoxy-D-xylulose-5-phosphate reductoisomerase [Gemmatimonadota bacterium]|nr:1-deoxy-D-xylulose-5-phosphate reductoisomerase [Gemmatimonadota bacterium]
MTNVVLLGATGSIGRSAVRVLRRHADRFRVIGLSASRSAGDLEALAAEFEPEFAVLAGIDPDEHAPSAFTGEWRYGPAALAEAAADPRADVVINALVGFAGLESTIAALEAGRRLALANKESLVVGGELVLEAWRAGGGDIFPVDSEHSAIHQCIGGRPRAEVRRLILTASGGPFRDLPIERFADIRASDALAHPTWNMGEKITVDSATLANKALEVIEAHLLFDIDFDDIDIVVHPSSIVHSLVEFRDGSTLAQLGLPTMELPILYALTAPERLADGGEPFDPIASSPLEFEVLRRDAFPMFGLGVAAGRAGGTAPAAYSAANEVAVAAFLQERIGFTDIARTVESVVRGWDAGPAGSVPEIVEADGEARRRALERIEKLAG